MYLYIVTNKCMFLYNGCSFCMVVKLQGFSYAYIDSIYIECPKGIYTTISTVFVNTRILQSCILYMIMHKTTILIF